MAIPASVLNDWEALTDEDRIKAQNYIRTLLDARKATGSPQRSYPFGLWEGGLLYMSEDFNDTPEGFEDYT